MSAAMSKGVIQNGASTQISKIHNQMCRVALIPIVFDKSCRFTLPCGVQQRLKCGTVGVIAEIQLVVGVKSFDARYKPMGWVADLNWVRLNRGMSHKLAT